MKRILCIVLVLCALPVCLFSCKREDSFDFPETAETLYPIVEGRRIPFKVLFVMCCGSDGGLYFVLRSELEAKNAIGLNYFMNWSEMDEGGAEARAQAVLAVDYEIYQVIAISAPLTPLGLERGIRPVVELIDNNGLTAVCDRVGEPDGLIGIGGHYTTVMLVRKSDYDLENCTAPFGLRVTGYLCDKNDPTYIQPSV